MTNEQLAALDAAATRGVWGSYRVGSVTQIEARKAPNGKNPCVVHWTGFDGNGYSQGKNRANANFITALVNAYRAGQLVVRTEPSEADVERVARAVIAAGYNPATAFGIARAAIAAMVR